MSILKKLRKQKAVTLTELLVVLAIIALLATVAVPVYVRQMQRARISTAQTETREIAKAMQAVAITHDFMVPIHILDNVPNREDNVTGNSASLDDFDNMQGGFSQRYLIDTTRPLNDQLGNNQLQLSDGSADRRVDQMIEGWQGPFLNPTRVFYAGQEPNAPGSGDITEDLVVDPWGNPYRIYSAVGLVSSQGVPTQSNEEPILGMDDLRLPSGQGEQADRFDRYAILSYGPDGSGVLGTNNPLIQGDDIFYTFSMNPGNESRYQFF